MGVEQRVDRGSKRCLGVTKWGGAGAGGRRIASKADGPNLQRLGCSSRDDLRGQRADLEQHARNEDRDAGELHATRQHVVVVVAVGPSLHLKREKEQRHAQAEEELKGMRARGGVSRTRASCKHADMRANGQQPRHLEREFERVLIASGDACGGRPGHVPHATYLDDRAGAGEGGEADEDELTDGLGDLTIVWVSTRARDDSMSEVVWAAGGATDSCSGLSMLGSDSCSDSVTSQ